MARADFLLEIKEVKGESEDQQYNGCIEILSYSFSGQNDTAFDYGSGGGKGKVHLAPFSITKRQDKASPKFFQALCSGEHWPKMVFHMRKQTGDGGKGLEYCTLTFEYCAVSTYSTSGHDGGDVMETVSFGFHKVTMDTKTQSPEGKTQSGPTGSYDLRTGKAA